MDMLNSVSTDRCLQARKRKINESLKLIVYFHVFFIELVQRISKCGYIQSTDLTPDKELNILIVWNAILRDYVIIIQEF